MMCGSRCSLFRKLDTKISDVEINDIEIPYFGNPAAGRPYTARAKRNSVWYSVDSGGFVCNEFLVPTIGKLTFIIYFSLPQQ